MIDGSPRHPPRHPHAVLAAALLLAALSPAPGSAQTGSDKCEPSPTRLCLLDDRFQVQVEWTDFSGNPLRVPSTPDSGVGHAMAVPGTQTVESGFFWFYDPSQVDLIVTMLDGTDINQRFWVFAAPLTNVEYRLTVVDTQRDLTRVYINPPGHLTVTTDTNAFPENGQNKAAPRSAAAALGGETGPSVTRAVFLPEEALPSCDDPGVACVQGDRFAIQTRSMLPAIVPGAEPTVILETATSALIDLVGNGSSVPLGARIVDGRAVDGRFWVFVATASSAQGLAVTVTDLETHQAVTYPANPGGVLAVAENDPFAPDPPSDQWLTTPEIPGFRFQVRVTSGANEIQTHQEADCIPETLCISGAVAGRSELFLRMVGPKPNGFLWPNLVKFSTSQIETWIEQLSTGQVNYYRLDAAGPASDDLTGFFDRRGFAPLQ